VHAEQPGTHPLDPMRCALRAAFAVLALGLTGCGRSEVVVSRRAELIARIETSDSRSGVACDVTHTLLGREDPAVVTVVKAGEHFTHKAALGTPPLMRRPSGLKMTLVARCPGYEQASSREVAAELGWLTTPRTDVGTITVERSAAQPRR
jgi:hypothetical protein